MKPQSEPQYTLSSRLVPKKELFGLLALFEEPKRLLDAALRAREEGYRQMQGYTPFFVEGLYEALGGSRDRVALITLIGGITGCYTGFGMQYYSDVLDYPMNVGGRPYFSWPAFIPVTFELTILFAALFAFFGMLFMNGLPRLHHPVFNVPEFERASSDGFFLFIRARDEKFQLQKTRQFLETLSPIGIYEVES